MAVPLASDVAARSFAMLLAWPSRCSHGCFFVRARITSPLCVSTSALPPLRSPSYTPDVCVFRRTGWFERRRLHLWTRFSRSCAADSVCSSTHILWQCAPGVRAMHTLYYNTLLMGLKLV